MVSAVDEDDGDASLSAPRDSGDARPVDARVRVGDSPVRCTRDITGEALGVVTGEVSGVPLLLPAGV